jgi:hypothetical protein
MTDKHPARAEPVSARTVLRWPDHPSTISAADQLADCGHNAKPRCRSAVRLWRMSRQMMVEEVARWGFNALTATSPSRLVLTPEGPKPKDAQNTGHFERKNAPGQTMPCDVPANLEFRLSSSSVVRFSIATTGSAISARRRYRRGFGARAPPAARISRWVPSSSTSFRCRWAARTPSRTAEQRTGRAMRKSTSPSTFLSRVNSTLTIKAPVPAT